MIVLIAIFAVLLIGIGFGCYYIPKVLGYPRAAKYFALVYFACLGFLVLQATFEDRLFTESDATTILRVQGIYLSDKHKLIENRTDYGFGDSYQTFTLKISEKDKTRIISQIKLAKHFKKPEEAPIDLLSPPIDQYRGSIKRQDYETADSFVNEYFKPNGSGYSPTFRRILIDKKENILIFEDIDL